MALRRVHHRTARLVVPEALDFTEMEIPTLHYFRSFYRQHSTALTQLTPHYLPDTTDLKLLDASLTYQLILSNSSKHPLA